MQISCNKCERCVAEVQELNQLPISGAPWPRSEKMFKN